MGAVGFAARWAERVAIVERHYDRGTVLRQLGVFHEPDSAAGRLGTLATHPVTVLRAYARKVLLRIPV